MQAAEAQGQDTVRLHTGDPSLYGAVREQMDALDALGIPWDDTPGVSSFCGAAAALGAEYTLPGVSQTLIVTRLAGRTGVPEREALPALAAHGASMALFLSAGNLEGVQQALLEGAYHEDTPAAIVYKATWPDECVVRCTVGTLAAAGAAAGITKTALLLVGGISGRRICAQQALRPGVYHGVSRGAGAVKIALLSFSAQGQALAGYLAEVGRHGAALRRGGFLSGWTEKAFTAYDALVFVGAVGIAVRAIAPFVQNKSTDPAVVAVDEAGRFAVPLLSGHLGGANDLARRIGRLCGAVSVITTATDVNGVFAVDEWARRQGCAVVNQDAIKTVSGRLLAGELVRVRCPWPIAGAAPAGVELTGQKEAQGVSLCAAARRRMRCAWRRASWRWASGAGKTRPMRRWRTPLSSWCAAAACGSRLFSARPALM